MPVKVRRALNGIEKPIKLLEDVWSSVTFPQFRLRLPRRFSACTRFPDQFCFYQGLEPHVERFQGSALFLYREKQDSFWRLSEALKAPKLT